MEYFSFDFDNNPKFKEYLNNLYPLPSNLEPFKRKWYKANIDPNFDITAKNPKEE